MDFELKKGSDLNKIEQIADAIKNIATEGDNTAGGGNATAGVLVGLAYHTTKYKTVTCDKDANVETLIDGFDSNINMLDFVIHRRSSSNFDTVKENPNYEDGPYSQVIYIELVDDNDRQIAPFSRISVPKIRNAETTYSLSIVLPPKATGVKFIFKKASNTCRYDVFLNTNTSFSPAPVSVQ